VFFDDGVALGIERDDADVRPVARVAGPARGMAFTGILVERVASGQDGDIVTVMALGGADVADAAVVMFDVVPMHESGRPEARAVEGFEAFDRELRPVFGGAGF